MGTRGLCTTMRISVMASNLYAGGIISVGTLLSVFLATSDEAVLILLGNPDQGKTVLTLLAVKVVIAVVAGYIIDLPAETNCNSKRVWKSM